MWKRTKLFLLLVVVCCSCNREAEPRKAFATLTEEEKRLPTNALSSMTVAPGLEVQLFASEPMVTNPTNISVDHLGRVWVCEAYNYDVSPEQADKKGDRIIVLEDTDHDGKADKRTVFYQGSDITTPLGIFVAGNDVYVSRSPNVLIFRDTDGDLVADSKDTLFTNLGPKGDHSAHAIFPGPDGLLYFSTGNMAGEIRDKAGNPVKDGAGRTVTQKGDPYLGGMIMRFDQQGNRFDVLGHNFRNNYEPCIDSYGNLWQSDNDDDGYESCRVNFILPYGNYGYLDEMTRASWMTNRIGLEENIQSRHWHQGDPGVVPNVLITGAGSPAGMVYYEGTDLPADYRNTPVHAEPYYNVVRSYVPQMHGAGYRAEVKDLLKSEDQWFRPVDVAIAPDGSLFIADWYDPILGGGAAGDAAQGRIYRVARNVSEYEVPHLAFSSIAENITALQNANPETRFQAFHNLAGSKAEAGDALRQLWSSSDPVIRTRALWLLANNDHFIRKAFQDENPSVRVAAIRATTQSRKDPIPLLREIADDKHPHVQRELITSLRYAHTQEAADLWVKMAEKYDGKDRWYLEALGIGSDLHADLFFETWLQKVQVDPGIKAHQDIIWRMRSTRALPLLARLIESTSNVSSTWRYFRAFDFHHDKEKNDVLMTLIDLPRKDHEAIAALALQQMDPASMKRTPALDRALRKALSNTRGTLAFVDLVTKFNVKDQQVSLIKLSQEASGTPVGNAAMNQLIRFESFDLIKMKLRESDSSAIALLKCMEGKGNQKILSMLSAFVKNNDASSRVRQAAVQILGSSWPGEEKLLDLVKDAQFPEDLKPLAASILFNVYRSAIQREAANYLQAPSAKGDNLPTVKELVASSGNFENGKHIFTQYCQSCHRIGQEGVKFGPELTRIGSKLSREGLYRAILYPDEGISHGYAGSLVTLKDGSQVMGIVINDTDTELEINLPGGIVNKYSKTQIRNREDSERSMMPGLAPAMSKQDLIDLVTYMATLNN